MDAEKLNVLVNPQSDDTLFVARYVEGLFTPLRLTLGELLGLLNLSPPVLTSEMINLNSAQTYQTKADIAAIVTQGLQCQLALRVPMATDQQTIINRTSTPLSVITIDGTLIEGQTSVVVPVGTTATFRFVVGANQWFA